MFRVCRLSLIITSFCLGFSACAPTVDIQTASPSITPTTTNSPTPTTTAVPPTPVSELITNLIWQEEDLEAGGYVIESKEDGSIVLWDQDEEKEHEIFRLNPDGSAVFWGIKAGADGVEEGQIGEEAMFSKEQMQGYQVAYEPTLGGDRARVILKDESGKVVSYYQDDLNSWRGEDTTASYPPMTQETFSQLYGSGGEENLAFIADWVKSNWQLGEKDKVSVVGDNGFISINWFDEETGKRETKFYSLLTGTEGFDTRVAENYQGNNWEADPEWQPTPFSRVTVMGHVEGLTHPDGTPIEIPISIGATQSSDIKRIVPSQFMADALARGYLEAYKARYEMQTGTKVSWEEYLKLLQKGQGAPSIPQPNEDAAPNAYYKYTKDAQFNPLAGVAIVFADGEDKTESKLPTKIGPRLSLKNYVDENGRLGTILFAGTNYVYNNIALPEAKSTNTGNVTAGEIFSTIMTFWPARIIYTEPDYCMRDGGPLGECQDIFYSEESFQFYYYTLNLTVEPRKQGKLNEKLVLDFQHTIPPQ